VHTEHVERRLLEYLDGTLAESLRPGVERHLEHCSACRTELAELRQTMELLSSQKTAPPPSGYFSTVVPHVRERLEGKESQSLFGAPMLVRFALPVGAAAIALAILLSLPFPAVETEGSRNPLQAVMHGATTDEVVDIVFDSVPLQPLSTPMVEGETSSLLGVRILRGDHLLANADEGASTPDITLDERMPEGLEQLNEADVEALVQHLGERTML
jgi:anti-sigma factor RsiW